MTMRGQFTFVTSLFFVAFCVVPTAAKFHGLFEYGQFEDYVAGREYVPQLSSFEAALLKIRSREGEIVEQLEAATGSKSKVLLPEVNGISLALDHPHKRTGEPSVMTSSRPAKSGNRRLGTIEHAHEVETRRAAQRLEMENEISRRILAVQTTVSGSTTKSVSVVSSGVSSPGTTAPPSTAAIGSDFYRFGSVVPAPSVNWSTTQVSTFVHFEGAFCQSCWAIAVADSVSLMWLINQGLASTPNGPEMLPTDAYYGAPFGNSGADMSPQQICDCMGGSCCNGGWPESALQYVQMNGGLSSWSNYPYTASPNATQCIVQKNTSLIARMTGFETVPAGNIMAVKQAVSMLPVIAFISSSSPDFGGYTGGIYNGNCSGTIDHVVLITGYGEDSVGGPYWIIKNSWGPYWGEQGYMRIAMTAGNGMCGITSSNALFPVYYPKQNPCKGTSNPCGSGTCFTQSLPGGGYQARCACPPGFVENFGSSSKCVPANPCDTNPNPCGAGTCSALKDGSYSCTCPPSMVGGFATNGNPRCVSNGAQSYVVQTNDTCTSISAAYNLPTGSLTQQNMWLNCSAALAPGAVMVIGKTGAPPGSVTYITQVSETCVTIAYGYGTTVAVLQQYNPTVNCSTLQLGTNLVLPPVPSNKLPTALPPTCATTYAVAVGDTCVSIAASLNLNTSSLIALNPDIDCSKPFSPPTSICAAAAPSGSNSTTAGCTKYYTVKQGDSCPSIWNYANLTMSQFMFVNPGIRCDSPHLWVGEIVCVAALNITLAIPQGVTYVVQAGDTLSNISSQWTRRCGDIASTTSIIAANPLLLGTTTTLSTGAQLLIPCPSVGASDACGCGCSGPAMCGSDYAWYANSCSSWCNGAGGGYPSCTACSQSCFGKVTLTAPLGTPWGCVSSNGGLCLPVWDGSCQRWLSGCQNQCYQAQWYGTILNNQYWPCLAKCRGNC